MSSFYSEAARRWQDRFDARRLADRFEATIVRPAASEEDREFIETRDFFFLATVDGDGWPQCSYKGGPPGLVRLLDERTLAFPSYDGNGMYLSMGNASDTGRVALLFVDFEEPQRLRLQGRATVSADDPLLPTWPGAELVVRVAIERIWPNCPRYVHRHRRVEASPYVPDAQGAAPVPEWKTFDFVRDVLPARDAAAAEAARARGGAAAPTASGSSLALRPATPADWPAIWAIVREVLARGDTYAHPVDTSEAEARALWLETPTATCVALHRQEIVGTYIIKPNQPGQGQHVCNASYMVAPAARGLGVGRALCAHSLEEAKRLGFSAMQYNLVVSTNERAIALWKAHGFEVVGRLPRAFRHPERGLVDALVMYRLLED